MTLWLGFQGSCLGRDIAAVEDCKWGGLSLKILVFAGTKNHIFMAVEFL